MKIKCYSLCLFIALMLCTVVDLMAQTITVNGRVSAEDDGSPLVGVNVLVKGTTSGVITGDNGRFSLTVSPNATLVFSYIGMKSQEIAINNRTSIDVSMQTDALSLSEVVVTSFGTSTRNSFTGSAGQISAKQIANRPIANISQAIVGATSGVQTSASTGQPGAAPAIRVRGFGSISASNSPLFVVDGVPYSAGLSNINPDDVENITILKDAASTALYGARAANGVVMITTKRGKSNRGKAQVNIRYSRGFSDRAIQEYERVNAFEYYPLMWEAYRNSLAYRASNPIAIETASQQASKDIKSLLAYNPFNVPDDQIVGTDGTLNPNAQLVYRSEDLDWEDKVTRQGIRDEVGISISGASEKSDYLLSVSYLDDHAFLIRSDFERYTARVNANTQATSWLKTGVNISGTYTQSNQNFGTGGTAFVNPFFFTRNIGPIYPVYAYDPANQGQYLFDSEGNRRYDFGNLSSLGLPNRPGGGFGGRHVVAETELNQEFYRRNVANGRTYAEITFLKDFKFTVNAAVDITNYTEVDYDNAIIGDGAPGGRSQKTYETTTSYNLNQLLNYTRTFGKHNLSVLAGHENYNERFDNLYGFRSQQIQEGNIELVNFTTTTDLTSRSDFYRVEGYFSRLNYDFGDKYFASFSYRRDGSSKFTRNVRWGDFYSASAAWRLDQEPFIQKIKFIDKLKLRSSYGETGNDAGISFYISQQLYTLGFNNATQPGIIESGLGNQLLEWEANRSFDVALEFALFKNRIDGSVEYFNRISDNLLFSVPLPLSAGILSQTRNIGSMYNRGIELNLLAEIVRIKDFSWSINFNATAFSNEITKLPQKEIISGTKKLSVGHSIYDYWLRDWYGVDPSNGAGIFTANTFVASNSKLLENGDTVSTSQNNARFHYNGSSIPDFFGSITNIFTYKTLALNVLLTYQQGGLAYDGTYAALMSSGNYGAALHKDVLNRWRNPGDITEVPRMDVSQTAAFNAASDRWLVDASFINIRNVTLTYSLPYKALNTIGLQNVQFFLAGENLRMFSKRKGLNVEQSFDGVITNEFSPARTISGGINVTL